MRFPTRPSTRSPLLSQLRADRCFGSEGAAKSGPLTSPPKGQLQERTRFPMFSKIRERVDQASLPGEEPRESAASFRTLAETSPSG